MLPVKNRRDREEKSVPPVFFLTGGRDEKMHRKRAKKNEKICKKFLAFPGTKCYTIKRTFARGLFSNPQKENAFQKFTTENSPTRGAKEQRKEDSS
ncbi:MAG: hypothetical protein WAV44_00665 [Fusicatenibacter saccharivorans]|jgi:hypothetical protein|nr:hypothetical protein [Fusicatenibacter saccharivorans]MBP7782632.1 hypothetical protein [Fusicatenibacter sp.]MBT9686843.1 hypothetical protein [Fusicatenibacter saccharivorans]MDU7834885.1 hypothetical protein [Blautia sp.]